MRARKHGPVFTVYPAIDVLDGRVVRLAEGVRERVTVEGGDPADAARRFAVEGASFLHLVDLDGAFSGSPSPGLVDSVAAAGVPVQAGGGYRDVAAIDAALAAGAARVMVGTAALSPAFLADAATRFGERLVVAIDARAGRVALAGWERDSGLAVEEAAERCAAAGVRRLHCTAIDRDGTMAGPDLDLLARVRDRSGLPVLAAGGIRSEDDLARLAALGLEGAVVGRALLEGRIPLSALARG